MLRDEEVRSISRRYLVSNGFDGALTCVGVVVGAFLTGVPNGLVVVQIGLGAAVGLATSGVWSVWEIERAEKLADLQSVEDAMLTELDDTQLARDLSGARVVNATASGLGPLVGILVPLVPFLVTGDPFTVGLLSVREATVASVGFAVAVLFAFGAYMGSISKQRWYVAGFRMGLAGLVVAGINLLLPG
nr:VIT1/CCC1 transporter family protein [Salinirubrum litoreum]